MAPIIQIIAVGQQDDLITGVPEITFWSSTMKQYSNFAVESIEQIFLGQVDFGRKASAVIGRTGDAVWQIMFQATLPEVNQNHAKYARWLDFIGEHMIAEVEVEVGGQKMDKHYGDFIHIWNQLTMPIGKQANYYKMIGHTTQLTYLTDPNFADIAQPCNTGGDIPSQVCAPRKALPETTLYIPLMFWFCTNPGMVLPIIALQFHEVRINVTLRPLGECLWAVDALDATEGNQIASKAYQLSLSTASLYIDYVFFDVAERKSMVADPHQFLIPQLQFPGDESVGSASTRIKVNLNHPVTELIWVVQADSHVDYCSSFVAGTNLFRALGAQPFNYTDAIDCLPNSIHAFSGPASVMGQDGFISTAYGGVFQQAGGIDAYANTATAIKAGWGFSSLQLGPADDEETGARSVFGTNAMNGVTNSASATAMSDAAVYVISELAHKMSCAGENPVITAKLQLNSQDRFSEREGSYFDTVQQYQFHTNSAGTGINCYSFAINPESPQLCGTLNFSRIDNANLNLVLSSAVIGMSATAKVRLYARSVNNFRIVGGMGGLQWAS